MVENKLGVVATLEAREGQGDTLLEILKQMAVFTRQEQGCFMYDVHRDLERPERFVIFERWSDEAALAAHMQAPHFADSMKVVAPCLAGRPTITKLQPIEP